MTLLRADAEAHAYADDCLAPQERASFEKRLTGDARLAAQVAQWRAQNEAIRGVFGERVDRFEVGGRRAGDPAAPVSIPGDIQAARLNRDLQRRRSLQGESARPGPAPIIAPRGRGARRLVRALMALLGGIALCVASADSWPADRSGRLMSSAMAAYRIYAGGHLRPVEFATADPVALEQWLRPQLGRFVPIPDLSRAGFTLRGGRIVPDAAAAAAALAIYRNGDERIAVVVEADNAPAASRHRIERRGGLIAGSTAEPGFSLALVAPASERGFDSLLRLLDDAPGA